MAAYLEDNFDLNDIIYASNIDYNLNLRKLGYMDAAKHREEFKKFGLKEKKCLENRINSLQVIAYYPLMLDSTHPD